MQTNNNQQYRVRINNYIRVPEVRVILSDGSMIGVMQTKEALKMAKEQNLDLVEINPRSMPPVCKIIDYGKFKYDEKKKQQEAKKHHKSQELKELTFRPNTDENDLSHKLNQARQFLTDGNKVKFTIRFRGREITHPEVGKSKLEWIIQELGSAITSNPQVNLEGKFMWVIVSPSKKQ